MGELKPVSIDTVGKFSNFEVLNPEFTRCRCNVFYTGRNRNYTDITEDALKKFIERKGYANMPVVGHLYRDPNDASKLRLGGHDAKLEITETSIKLIDQTVPFGVIPEDCNPSMETITEKSGIKHDYFSVDVILWSNRYPIMDAAYSEDIYFNQSMEIMPTEVHYDGDYTVIDDFNMSALCLLNLSNNKKDNVEPCFESSRVKKFQLDEEKFRSNFNLLLNKLKEYSQDKTIKECKDMDLTKFNEKLSEYKFTDENGNEKVKYKAISALDNTVTVADCEDYSVYGFDYANDENGELVINTNKKVVGYCNIVPSDDEGATFSFADCISDAEARNTETLKKSFSEEYDKIAKEMTEKYDALMAEYKAVKSEYDVFKAADDERKENEKREAIDKVVTSFQKKIGRSYEFLTYRAKLDYTKSVEEITRELTVMAGQVLMQDAKKEFSYTPKVADLGNVKTDASITNKRYGNLLDKYSIK